MSETATKSTTVTSKKTTKSKIKTDKKTIQRGLELMCTAKTMAEKYEENAKGDL
jgi:hypothetical protein